MSVYTIPRIVIAGTQSGVGKTTIVTGLLAAFKALGLAVQSYKVGPDYIDPAYHTLASGKPTYNLDTWLVPQAEILPSFIQSAAGNDLVIIEGVMGLFDGGKNGISSTAAIAKLLQAPVLLVIDAKAMGESIAAIALGFKQYDPELVIAGVIANRLGSQSHGAIVEAALKKINISLFGEIRRSEDMSTPERHLGLTPVGEIDSATIVKNLGVHIAKQVQLADILAVAKAAVPLTYDRPPHNREGNRTRIGVAYDEVFSFYYPASLEALERQGAELVYFSPLRDSKLPDVDGLLFGGGFPEMFLQELAENTAMLSQIAAASQSGLPIVAECGGLMYLSRQILDFTGQAFDMVGIIPAVCKMASKLQTVGYVEAVAEVDNVLCLAGQSLRGHEFHFSTFIPDEQAADRWAFQFKKMRTGQVSYGGYAWKNVVASYLHLHFAGSPKAAKRFVDSCVAFHQEGKYRD